MASVLDRIMREKDSLLPRTSSLSFSTDLVEISINAGDTVVDSFKIMGANNLPLEGAVTTHDLRMTINTEEITGMNRTIFFQYSASGLKEGEVVAGTFHIVTNYGEYELPYRVTVFKESLDSSLGPIRNLFLFANLAKASWQEAVSIFYQKSFAELLTGNDAHYKTVYEGLAAGDMNPRNVEVFLQLTKKKTPVRFLSDEHRIEMNAPKETTLYQLKLVKDGWGFDGFQVKTEGAFLLVEDLGYESGVFGEQSTIQIPYYVQPDKLRQGVNEGKIIISNFASVLEIPLIINAGQSMVVHSSMDDVYAIKITKMLLAFKLGKTSKGQWLRECRELLVRAKHFDDGKVIYVLYEAHLLLSEKKYDEAAGLLAEAALALRTEEKSLFLLAYHTYLLAMLEKDPEEQSRLTTRIEDLYMQDQESWKLAYFHYLTCPIYQENEERAFQFLKQMGKTGMNSPILYMEAFLLLSKKPTLLTELNDFTVSVLIFAYKQQMLSKELRSRFAFLTDNIKVYSGRIYRLLCGCYSLDKKDDTLVAICNLLMRGNKIGNEYFKWFQKGVEQELRINGLYEYFMLSIDLAYEGKLPKLILMYFAYRNNLDYDRSAFLYSNVLKHGKEYKEIFEDYLPVIETFAREQLLKRRISDNLAYIYEQFASRLLTEPEFASAYAELIFTYELTIKKPEINAVVVRYAHLKDEVITPVFKNVVQISVVGAASEIFLEDAEGNRYIDESLYEKRRMIPDLRYEYMAMMNANLDLMLCLYRSEEAVEQSGVTTYNIAALQYLIHAPQITESFRRELLMMLLRYYFEKDEWETIDELMLLVKPAELSAVDYETCVHILVARGFYEEAFRWVKDYGQEQLGDRVLLRLFDRMLPRLDYGYDVTLLRMGQALLSRGKYDVSVLEYLLKNDNGTIIYLKSLWRAADAFELDTRELLERMLVQILYTGIYLDDEVSIYQAYCEKGANAKLDKAFLTRLSYRYFTLDDNIDERVFDRVAYYASQDEDISEECKLAYLKHTQAIISRKERLFDAEKQLVTRFTTEFLAAGIRLPMFLTFAEFVPGLTLMQDRAYIEHHAKPGSRVILHYVLEKNAAENADYKKEEMVEVYKGIYTYSFVLFAGENVSYYITEEDGRQEKLTKSATLTLGDREISHASERFKILNEMAKARSGQDDLAYVKLTESYMQKSFVADKLFTVFNG
ncbi:MAG: DUF5717 family protein [Lachnospiraceae bacterium]|nr:DUF5717 family protein [Lachnospiraceae bacterium]